MAVRQGGTILSQRLIVPLEPEIREIVLVDAFLRAHHVEADLDEEVCWILTLREVEAQRVEILDCRTVCRVLGPAARAAVDEPALVEQQQLVELLVDTQLRLVDGGDDEHPGLRHLQTRGGQGLGPWKRYTGSRPRHVGARVQCAEPMCSAGD